MLAGEAGRLSPGAIDLVHLANQTGGDEELEQELLALFADQCVRLLRVIREAQPRDGGEAAHTLKGAARAVGAWSVAAAAEKVEKSLHGGRAVEGLAELASAADEARAAIAALGQAA